MSFTLETKNTATPDIESVSTGFLLQETGEYLLLENGDKFLLDIPYTDLLGNFTLASKNSSTPSYEIMH